ncbi:DUF3311 domain-containing protein [Luteolibacter marinus]|uniref:DUF3311 domain-containing protein n=1 Tax=Luteolibacter marinus TaxID=2776705 RepID=UPI001866F747|nr:DUF3311 domain-containing protein [Luteolibacter marinus]
MRKPVLISIVAFVVLFALHHDAWNWDNTTLVLGFLPIGLAYHAGYSIVAGLFWYLVSRFAWPESIEKWADEPND